MSDNSYGHVHNLILTIVFIVCCEDSQGLQSMKTDQTVQMQGLIHFMPKGMFCHNSAHIFSINNGLSVLINHIEAWFQSNTDFRISLV